MQARLSIKRNPFRSATLFDEREQASFAIPVAGPGERELASRPRSSYVRRLFFLRVFLRATL
jgi:hypothetical protein